MRYSILILLLAFAVTACVKRDPMPLVPEAPDHQEEVITSIVLNVTDSASAVKRTYWFADNDGPGGAPPSYAPGTGSVITLSRGGVYYFEILLLNTSREPADTISKEVEEEGAEHMIFFDAGQPLPFTATNPEELVFPGGIVILYQDQDSSVPASGLGLRTKWTCPQSPVSGDLRITLKHQPDGKTGRVQDGETDLQVFFGIAVQ